MKRISLLRPRARFLLCLALTVVIGLLSVLGLNAYVLQVGGAHILSPEEAIAWGEVDCIVILGCRVLQDGTPSHMLQDRLDTGLSLFSKGAAPKLLMSGDHGRADYNEVGTMKAYALQHGVPEEHIFMDHAGFSTYESLYRAKEIFGAERILIVTQEYHLYRALYIAQALGMEAGGVASDQHTYSGQAMRDLREIPARCKDVLTTLFRVKPTYLGDPIPLSGSGAVTEPEQTDVFLPGKKTPSEYGNPFSMPISEDQLVIFDQIELVHVKNADVNDPYDDEHCTYTNDIPYAVSMSDYREGK